MATPFTYWLWFHIAVLALLAGEYAMAQFVHETRRKAVIATGIWVIAALVFAFVLHPHFGTTGTLQYVSGYAIEEALSIDNLFVFLLLFRLFQIPEKRQPRVLFWGVAGAIVMRGAFIAGGIGLLARFHWIGYIFAVVLIVAAVRLLKPECETEEEKTPRWLEWLTRLHPISPDTDHFFALPEPAGTAKEGAELPLGHAANANLGASDPEAMPAKPRRIMTVLLLSLIAVELTDIVFALDSIPAVLSITRIPFLAYTSNIMAVMGLRSLYVLLAAMLKSLRFMHYGLAALLIFAAGKMLISDWVEIGPIASLLAIAAVLAVTIAASLLRPRNAAKGLSSKS